MKYFSKANLSRVISSLFVVLVVGMSSVFAATFTNNTAIVISGTGTPNGAPYPSPITVSGLTGNITEVKVTINNFSHTWADDVGIVLVGPTGAAFGLQSGAGDAEDGSPISGTTYTFADSAATTLPDNDSWLPGNYKPSVYYSDPLDTFPAPGPGASWNNPGPAGGGTSTFASVYNGTAPNGTWNLFVKDFVNGDGGSIAGGWTIEITTGSNPVVTPQNIVDFNGDGKTDWTVVRNTGGGGNGQITWFTAFTGVAGGRVDAWGLAGDEFVPVDYDGDNKTDIAIWRPDPTQGAFYILNSATGTLRAETFGKTGDDPSVVGDYNGDGNADLAVYRAGATAGAPSTWFYRTTAGGPYTAVQWGQNGDFPVPGDYDGDAKSDFVVQRNAGGGQARIWQLFATGSSTSAIFGTPTDLLVPGDYDADGKTDLAVVRGSAGSILWQYQPSGGGAVVSLTFGASATDFPVQGDYDGDGKTDIAVWRNTGTFYVNRSNGSGLLTFAWGQTNDYAVANYNAH